MLQLKTNFAWCLFDTFRDEVLWSTVRETEQEAHGIVFRLCGAKTHDQHRYLVAQCQMVVGIETELEIVE